MGLGLFSPDWGAKLAQKPPKNAPEFARATSWNFPKLARPYIPFPSRARIRGGFADLAAQRGCDVEARMRGGFSDLAAERGAEVNVRMRGGFAGLAAKHGGEVEARMRGGFTDLAVERGRGCAEVLQIFGMGEP